MLQVATDCKLSRWWRPLETRNRSTNYRSPTPNSYAQGYKNSLQEPRFSNLYGRKPNVKAYLEADRACSFKVYWGLPERGIINGPDNDTLH